MAGLPAGSLYETDELLHQYLIFHYGRPGHCMPHGLGPTRDLDFPKRCATELCAAALPDRRERALDLGCAVGRSTYELTRWFDSVTGVDFSNRFVETAREIGAKGCLPAFLKERGARHERVEAALPADVFPEKAAFEQGDAMELREDLGSFDLVLAANLICRLREPQRLFARLPELVRPGGSLALATPFTWLEEWTPRSNWIAGDANGNDPVAALALALGSAFKLVDTMELPFVIREHERKYQWSVSLGTLWKRA